MISGLQYKLKVETNVLCVFSERLDTSFPIVYIRFVWVGDLFSLSGLVRKLMSVIIRHLFYVVCFPLHFFFMEFDFVIIRVTLIVLFCVSPVFLNELSSDSVCDIKVMLVWITCFPLSSLPSDCYDIKLIRCVWFVCVCVCVGVATYLIGPLLLA